MGLFIATVKNNVWQNGIKLEKGMSVEFISNHYDPLHINGGMEIVDAFMRKYGVDIKKACAVSDSYILVQKLN